MRKRANVYFDGFNFYYGCVRGTPHRWLDLGKLCRMVLPEFEIGRIRYFTALVKSFDDPGQPQRQQAYFRALVTIPNLSVHYGHFTINKKWRRLAHPAPRPAPQGAHVLIPEEKGSDVNLASYLLVDGFDRDYEVAVVVSNDSDLLLPIEMVRARLGLDVGVINPYRDARPSLQTAASFYRTVAKARCVRPIFLTRSLIPTDSSENQPAGSPVVPAIDLVPYVRGMEIEKVERTGQYSAKPLLLTRLFDW
jgi:hypothetical protein